MNKLFPVIAAVMLLSMVARRITGLERLVALRISIYPRAPSSSTLPGKTKILFGS